MRFRLALLFLVTFSCQFHVECFAQQIPEVQHFAGSPGGVGTADGVGTATRFQSPAAVWGDGTYLYVSDQLGRAIRRVSIATGEAHLVAGSLTSSAFADGRGDAARFNNVQGVWGDGTYLYIAECNSGRIRRMTLATADVGTIAGTGPGTPVDGPASQAVFRCPLGIWGNGRFLYVTDSGFFPIRGSPIPGALRKIDLLTSTVSTMNLPLAAYPTKLAGDGRELFITLGPQIYAMDLGTGSFRVVASLINPSGLFRSVGGMWSGADGFLYLSDSGGHEVVRINASTQEVQSLFGLAYRRDWIDGIGSQARLRGPVGIWGDGSRLYIADSGNHVIRVGDLNTLAMTTLAGVGVHVADQTQNPTTPSGVHWSDGTYLYFTAPLSSGTANQIWKMPISGGQATVVAGSPGSGYVDGPNDLARFTFITSIWGDGSFLYLIDGFGDRLRKVSLRTGDVTTLVSVPGLHPFQTTVSRNIWGDGTYLFVSGSTNIFKVSLATGSMETVAGIPHTEGADDGVGQNARFKGSGGLWGDARYLYIADAANNLIRRMSLATYEVATLAGRAGVADVLDGIGSQALFNYPTNVWSDGTNLYITDMYTVRRVSLATNEVRTVAGSRVSGLADGVGSQARFSSAGTLWGVGGLLYIGDEGRVRTVDTTSGEVETIAGRPVVMADGVGMNARFYSPTGIWGDTSYLYVTDRSNHVLRRINRLTGEVKTVAGLAGEAGVRDAVGDKARFNNPKALCSDGVALYVADSGNDTIRKITIGTWKVETVAGTPGVAGRPEALQYINPSGLWCDNSYIYVSDFGTIRKIAIATGKETVLVSNSIGTSPLWSDGRFLYFSDQLRGGLKKLNLSTLEITTVNSLRWPESGNVWGEGRYLYMTSDFSVLRLDLSTEELASIAGSDPFYGTEDGIGAEARFQRPSGLWSDGSTLYVADTDNHAIRTITLAPPSQNVTSIPFAVPAGGSFSRITRNAGEQLTVGYARVKAEDNSTPPAGIAVYGFRSNGVLVSETGVPAVAPFRTGRIYAETTATVRTGLAIANPNSQSVTISFYFTDASGQNFGSSTMILDGNRQVAAFLDEQPFLSSGGSPRPLAEARTFTFSASQPVAAIALRGFVNERGDFLMTTLPIADLSRSTSDTVVIPHFAEGGGWTTQIALVNPSDENIAETVRFFDQSGTPIETQSYAIAPRSSIVIRRSSSDSVIRVGSIHITSNPGQQTPVGLSIFSYSVSGITVTQTGVPTIAPTSVLTIYAENSASLRSGFAFANATSQPVTLNYDVLSNDGSSIRASGSLEIPANGQRALFLNELPGAQALSEFKGVLRITASGLISAIGLRGRTNERGEFLVSTTMPDQDSAVVSTELYIPHFVHGGGYTTEFILIGRGITSGASGNSGLIQFYLQSGQAETLTLE